VRIRRQGIALLWACVPLLVTGAQETEVVAVITAATVFARASIIGAPGPIVIDETSYRRGPGISEPAALRVAQATGSTRGAAADVIRCEEPRPRTHQRCASAAGAVVLTFARPEIRDSVATVGLAYTYVDYRGRPVGQEWALELQRSPNGRWRVTRSKETGVS